MNSTRSILAMVVLLIVPVMASAQETTQMPHYVVMKHMNGSLALQTSQISAVWFMTAGEKPAQIRVLSEALSEPKTLGGADAESLWKTFHDSGMKTMFVLVSHMGGTLAIPRDQIRTVFYSDESGKAKLRLGYTGDPSGKTLEGEEATRVWKMLVP